MCNTFRKTIKYEGKSSCWLCHQGGKDTLPSRYGQVSNRNDLTLPEGLNAA